MKIQINKHTKITMITVIVSIIMVQRRYLISMQIYFKSQMKWNQMIFMVEHVKLSFSPKKVKIQTNLFWLKQVSHILFVCKNNVSDLNEMLILTLKERTYSTMYSV